MSFSVVRGFICSAFGPLNPNHLPKIFPFPVRPLDNMASGGEDEKGINEGEEEWRDSLELRMDQFHTSTGITAKWTTCHDWEFHR